MVILRFIAYLVGGLLAPLLIIPLGILWILTMIVLGLCHTWLRAKRDPRYNPYWDVM